MISPPRESKLEFKRFSRLNQHELSGYLDFETYHKKVEDVCFHCEEFIRKCHTDELKRPIIDECTREKHIKTGKHFCDTCKKDYRDLLKTYNCSHNKPEFLRGGEKYLFPVCLDCHKGILDKLNCTHSSTQNLTSLTPASYNFR